MKKVIITAALTGSVPSKERFPNLPITVDEIVEDAIKCHDAGAAVVHIHVRDKVTGKNCHDEDQFRAVKEILTLRCPDLIVQLSTGGRYEVDAHTRNSGLRCHPEMASWCPGSVGFPTGAYVNTTEFYTEQAKYMLEHNIKPEIECFDTHMAQNAIDFCKEGLLKEPLYFDFVMGVQRAQPASLPQLGYLLGIIPKGSEWNLAGIGSHQASTILWALGAGGHVRVGLEDNQYLYKGVPGSNPQFVERVVRIAKEIGREIASGAETRKMLGVG
ncbi:MAG: 3-keto-5-aminohexanoate cleavage protein [Acidaminococcales bacterium]|jgi:3-keto-5-aminohexanoate cleavage enzyme|nr:3-keto-5-aminohexanoate cleavage protein [Acidaminococcales bacterium]